jgi:predicted acyl esterase
VRTSWLVVVICILLGAFAGTAPAAKKGGKHSAKACKQFKSKKKRARCKAKRKKCPKGTKKTYLRKRTLARCNKKPKKPKKPGTGTSSAPIDYTQIKGLSQAKYSQDEIVTEQLFLPSFDGTELYVEVIRPKAPGRYPVIAEISGYHGTLYDRTGTRILPAPTGPDGEPLGLVGYFVPRGYAVVMVDLRGTGKSAGCLDHLGPNDFGDIKLAIEWAASQPWSNGRVGQTGHSYVGGTTNLAGASGAKGLATIVPSASLASMYDHQFQAGVPYNAQYLGPIEAYEQLALQADLPPQLSPVTGATGNGPTGEAFGLHPADTGCGAKNSAALAGTGQVTGQYEAFHAERDYRELVKKAKVPIFLQHGTLDQAARIAGVQWMFDRGLPKGDKLWVGPWDHGIGSAPTTRGLQWTYALHAWFDKHLMGRKVDTGAPLEVFLNDEADDRTAFSSQGQILAGRKLPRTEPFVLTAAEDEKLGSDAGEEGTVNFAGDANGYAENNEAAGGVTFQTEPLVEDHLFFGVPSIRLMAATSDPQTHLISTLFAVDEDGKRRRLTQCAMNPILKDGVDKTAQIVPQQLYELKPPCFAMAYQARAGEKLRLRVTTSDPDKLPVHSTDPNVVVGFGGSDGTQITLPEVTKSTYADTIYLGDTTGDANSTG